MRQNGINWTSVAAFVVFHAAAVAALFFFTWPAFFVAVALYWISLSLGIGMGYPPAVDSSFLRAEEVDRVLPDSLRDAGPGRRSALSWVTTHRIHHRFSDQDGDPHTPHDGKWWSHILWMTVGDATNCTPEEYRRYSPDLCRDRFLVLLSKYFYVPLVIVGVLLFAWGGWPLSSVGVFSA